MPELISQLLKDEKIPGFALVAFAISKYDYECFDWQPEFLRKQIEDDTGVQLTDLQSDKLQAAITVLKSDTYEDQWEVFATINHILSGVSENFESVDPDDVEAEEVIRGLSEVSLIKSADHTPLVFSDEVRAFAGAIFYKYGFSKAPKLCAWAIIPSKTVDSDDTEKNEALQEMWDETQKFIVQWANRTRAVLNPEA